MESTEESSKLNSADPFNVEYWRNRWVENRTGWHKSVVHLKLLQFIGEVTGQSNLTAEPLSNLEQFEENKKKTWFIPLCGKTLDISYLLSQGFSVFGVEAVRLAIETMGKEQNIELSYDEDRKLFTGVDGRLKIYHGDFFTCPYEQFGPFHYIWDRGSFIAVEYSFREKYIETMKRILQKPDGSWHNFVYLLETVEYDKSKFEGPPRSVDGEDMQKFFSSWATVKMLISDKVVDSTNLLKHVGEGGATSSFFLITPSIK